VRPHIALQYNLAVQFKRITSANMPENSAKMNLASDGMGAVNSFFNACLI
jgi:hypothetical protein